jgi:hypothetical protein
VTVPRSVECWYPLSGGILDVCLGCWQHKDVSFQLRNRVKEKNAVPEFTAQVYYGALPNNVVPSAVN